MNAFAAASESGREPYKVKDISLAEFGRNEIRLAEHVLAGDLNARIERSRTLADLASEEWGFAVAGEGIDHILVRGARTVGRARWPRERRRHGGRVLSDHAPVELTIR